MTRRTDPEADKAALAAELREMFPGVEWRAEYVWWNDADAIKAVGKIQSTSVEVLHISPYDLKPYYQVTLRGFQPIYCDCGRGNKNSGSRSGHTLADALAAWEVVPKVVAALLDAAKKVGP